MKGRTTYLSSVVDGRCTDGDIADRFRDLYEELYSSVPDGDLHDVVGRVKNLVDDRCNAGRCTSSLSHIVPPAITLEVVRSLALDKMDETYNISSNRFINGTELLYSVFSQITTIMLHHGSTDVLFNKAVIKPIPKISQKSRADSSNYRAISLNSITSKIRDHVIIMLIKDKIKKTLVQFAYKESHTTSLCSF